MAIRDDDAPTRLDGPLQAGSSVPPAPDSVTQRDVPAPPDSLSELNDGYPAAGDTQHDGNAKPLGAAAHDDPPTRITAIPTLGTASGDSLGSAGTAFSITTLSDTLHLQDVERTRSFMKIAAVVAVLMALPLPFLGGNDVTKTAFGVSMAAIAVVAVWLARQLRDPLNYRTRPITIAAVVCVTGAFAGINYFGVFSPAPIVIPFGLYFFGLSQSFRGTLAVCCSCGLAYLVFALFYLTGTIADPGLINASGLGILEMIAIVSLVEVLIFATYMVARMSRRATEDALEQHDRAVRAVAGRDALLAEARMDLQDVLRARGLGRFTDEVVGSYRLGDILGRGGMGEVYDAVHVDREDPAAVKLLHGHILGDPDNLKRFLRECKVAASLDVPNVVRVFETSEPDEPIPYIAMERLHGQDLSDYLRAHGRMRMTAVLRLIRQVGRGLDAARAKGIVHRDIKPRNLFLAEQQGTKRAMWKILDFGVSKLMSEQTMTNQSVVGTPSYMAPEQATGDEVSHRADLFALAVIAYRALTGRPAFPGDAPAAILYQVVHRMPPRPSDFAPKLNADIDDVLAIALAKDPWERFDSATELADALENASKERLPAALRERAARLHSTHPWN